LRIGVQRTDGNIVLIAVFVSHVDCLKLKSILSSTNVTKLKT
jgi:hypothetical protein